MRARRIEGQSGERPSWEDSKAVLRLSNVYEPPREDIRSRSQRSVAGRRSAGLAAPLRQMSQVPHGSLSFCPKYERRNCALQVSVSEAYSSMA